VQQGDVGQTFDVPRTALLLTGAVQALLPLPASFSAAVANTQRTTSAADLLWPSNIGHSGSGPAAAGGPLGAVSMGGARHKAAHAGVQLPSGADRQHSAPSAASVRVELAPQQERTGSSGAAHARAGGGTGTAGTSSSSSSGGGGSGTVATTAGNGSAAAAADPSVLVAPCELPPGEFKCLAHVVLLQVR
jgi:hypothetical protein